MSCMRDVHRVTKDTHPSPTQHCLFYSSQSPDGASEMDQEVSVLATKPDAMDSISEATVVDREN